MKDDGYRERNQEQLERLRQLVSQLSDNDLTRELPGGWTVADTLAHLAFYDRRAAILLERFAREGVSESPYDFETINQALLSLTRRLPPRAAAEEAIAAAEAANAAAAATPAEIIGEIQNLGQVKIDRSEHRESHLGEIEQTLGRR